ncbi:MAG TPA: sigma-70 family RNA polymerase sigma factor [Burkholderiaceae bacterium]|nr:sigma-70 family RNA polymerase sigma factor [Burkholderiaceae bacterium]
MVVRYYRELLSFLSRSVQDRELAADLTQESYLRLLSFQEKGTAVAEPRGFLYRTARNLVTDRYRSQAARGASQAIDRDADELPDESLAALQAPAATEPQAAASSTQFVNAMVAVIDGLPARCREAFILHKFDGLTQVQVAAEMGISVKMVERHIKIALQACRRCQAELEGDPGLTSAVDKSPPEK